MSEIVSEAERLAMTERPSGQPAGFQRWRHLLFLHWEVEARRLRPLVPDELALDTFEGRAYVGLVPFTMLDVGFHAVPGVPHLTRLDFHEHNVRTYVHRGGRDPGVFFFSLDAASSLAVAGARMTFHLPYHRASMRLSVQGEGEGARVGYRTRRLWPGPRPAELEVSYRVGPSLGAARPGTFEHFVLERYVLFAKTPAGLRVGRVHHRPYPMHAAEVASLRDTTLVAAGLPAASGPPHALYSPGVDVDVFALEARR